MIKSKLKITDIDEDNDEDFKIGGGGADADDDSEDYCGGGRKRSHETINTKEYLSYSDCSGSLTMASDTLSFHKLAQSFSNFWVNIHSVSNPKSIKPKEVKGYVG